MGGTLLVENDADFRVPGFHRALHIGVAVVRLQRSAQLVGGAFQAVEVITGENQFQWCREAEQARTRVTVIRSRQIGQLLA